MGTALQTAASKYIGRWKHRLTLHFRVWPKYKETHDIIAKEKLIPINGIRINATPCQYFKSTHRVSYKSLYMSDSEFFLYELLLEVYHILHIIFRKLILQSCC